MSTQQLVIPGNLTGRGFSSKAAIGALIVAAMFVGGLVGRSTATTPSAIIRPAAVITVGTPSRADAGRSEMFRAMNGLRIGTAAPGISIEPKDVSSGNAERLSEMFRAMNGLRHQQL